VNTRARNRSACPGINDSTRHDASAGLLFQFLRTAGRGSQQQRPDDETNPHERKV
jgi:hypothetical protein